MVTAKYVSAPDSRLQDPRSTEWRTVPQEELQLDPTPLTSQPSLYVQASWAQRPYGQGKVSAQAAHNRNLIYFRLTWEDDTPDATITDTDRFADAAAVLFPVRGDAPLTSMGTPAQPVEAWYWRADLVEPFSVTAQGTGSSARHPDAGVGASALYADGAWTVVLWRALGSTDLRYVDLRPGVQAKVAFGVWQGSNHERAGLKAVTLEWQPLEIEE